MVPNLKKKKKGCNSQNQRDSALLEDQAFLRMQLNQHMTYSVKMLKS